MTLDIMIVEEGDVHLLLDYQLGVGIETQNALPILCMNVTMYSEAQADNLESPEDIAEFVPIQWPVQNLRRHC
jgi:hypothetical protein